MTESTILKSTNRFNADLVNVDITDYRYLLKSSIDLNLTNESTIFVFIQSKDSNREKRKQIRETCANRKVYLDYYHNPIYVIFTVGLPQNVLCRIKLIQYYEM